MAEEVVNGLELLVAMEAQVGTMVAILKVVPLVEIFITA